MSKALHISIVLACLASAGLAEKGPVAARPVKFQLLAGTPVVDGVYLNGMGPYRFLVDTGSQRSRIALELAQELGWSAVFQTRTITQTTDLMRDGFRVASLRVGDLETENEEFVAASMESIRKLDPAIRGFLGQSFLRKQDYLIDYKRKQIRFGAAAVRGGTRTGFGLSHGCMVTETSHGQLTLDSGATTVVLYNSSAVKWKGAMAVHTTEGEARVRFGELKSLKVAGREFRNVETAESARQKFDETDTDGLLPASLFSALYVSNSGGYVVFDPER